MLRTVRQGCPDYPGHPGLSGSTKALSCAHLLVKLRTSCLWCFYYATPKVSLASDRNLRGTAGTGTLLRCRTTVVREPEAPEPINGRNPTNRTETRTKAPHLDPRADQKGIRKCQPRREAACLSGEAGASGRA